MQPSSQGIARRCIELMSAYAQVSVPLLHPYHVLPLVLPLYPHLMYQFMTAYTYAYAYVFTYAYAYAYVQERKAFGKPLSDFGQIQKAIAESYAEYMAGKSYLFWPYIFTPPCYMVLLTILCTMQNIWRVGNPPVLALYIHPLPPVLAVYMPPPPSCCLVVSTPYSNHFCANYVL